MPRSEPASINASARMLRQSDLRGVKVVVLGFDIRQIANCQDVPERWDGVGDLLRYGVTWDQFGLAVFNVEQWLDGALPRHRHDGSRLTDERTVQPPDWQGAREQRYRSQLATLAAGLRRTFGKFDIQCATVIAAVSDYVHSRNAAFVPVLIPINLEAIAGAGLDREQLAVFVRDKVSPHITDLVDLTAGDFSSPRNFGPRDALHFIPATGAAVIGEALNASAVRWH